MPVTYYWVSNPVKPGTYYPRAARKSTVRTAELVETIAHRTVVQPVDVRAVVDALSDVIVNALQAGRSVIVDEFLGFSLALELKDPALGDRLSQTVSDQDVVARVNVTAKPPIVRRVNTGLTIEKGAYRVRMPQILQIFDHVSEAFDQYTKGGVIDIRGGDLAFPQDFQADSQQGVFFVAGSGKETRAQVYVKHGQRVITCMVPAGVNGTVSIEVRTTYGGPELRRRAIDDITPSGQS